MVWGCRLKNKDYITEHIFKFLTEFSSDLKIRISFSRETEEKMYVQHLLTHFSKVYGQFILDNLESIEIYVCGSSKFLPKSLDKAFRQCFVDILGTDKQEQADSILAGLYTKDKIKFESFA